jgi:hypothetical protein
MKPVSEENFKRHYQSHLKHLTLKGLQPKTIEAYARAIRRIGAYFDHRIDALSEQQLLDYFSDLLSTHSWSAVKLDLYGLKFFYTHVLRKPWVAVDLIKPPKARRLPDIVTVEEAGRLFQATRTLSYRIFYFTLYTTASACASVRACGYRWAISMPSGGGYISGMPRAIRIASHRCRIRPWYRCAVSGSSIAIPRCCFPIARRA